MTLHQTLKMLYLSAQSDCAYYLYQASEEDWDPTIDALVQVDPPLPASTDEDARVAYNTRFQLRELVHLAAHPYAAANVSRATAARLRAYVAFFL